MGGAFTWDEVARYRERWKRPLVVKGILHPADAEKALALGVDGIVVSNHGGRQVEALPAAIDVLPAIAAAVGGRATVMMDSGIRSGPTWRARSRSAPTAAFAGKAFLWGLGALGDEGPGHVIDLMIDEMKSAFGQIGARRPAEARSVVIRHPGALRFLICAGGASGLVLRRCAGRTASSSARIPFGERGCRRLPNRPWTCRRTTVSPGATRWCWR